MGEGAGGASAIYKPQPYISHPPPDRWLGWKLYDKGLQKALSTNICLLGGRGEGTGGDGRASAIYKLQPY